MEWSFMAKNHFSLVSGVMVVRIRIGESPWPIDRRDVEDGHDCSILVRCGRDDDDSVRFCNEMLCRLIVNVCRAV